ncbi:MAG: FtsX-like permease family protein [Ktedonobacteraceae bacterium]
MARSTTTAPLPLPDTTLGRTRNRKGKLLPSTITLAFWRVRRTWGLLFVTGLGMIAAVMIVCTVPLYSEVAMTAGLRGVLSATPQNADIVVQSTAEQLSTRTINSVTNTLNQEFQTHLGPYLGPSHFSIETPVSSVYTLQANNSLKASDDQVQFVSAPIDQATQHASLVKGNFPRELSSADLTGRTLPAIDVAITPQEAAQLHVGVGSLIATKLAYVQIPVKRVEKTLSLHVVGIFTPETQSTSFWHAHDFLPLSRGEGVRGSIYTLLVSSNTMLYVFNQFNTDAQTQGMVLEEPFTLYWFYRFDASHVTIDDLDAMVAGVNTIQVDLPNNPALDQSPYIEKTQATLPSDVLTQYLNRVPIARVPVFSLLALVMALVLFFVSMMADLLVDRQSDAVSILRSRGASRSQVFGAFVTQSFGLGLVAFIVGPLLALLLVSLIARQLLPASDQGALSIITSNPVSVALGLRWFALGTAAIAIIAMVISINRATRSDVLAMRREAARSAHRPLWLRLNLDLVAATVMVVGYGFSVYLTSSGILDVQTRLLLLSPLTLLGSVFLLIACILLFLRVFPSLLNFGARLAGRNRGAAPMLALAQMARAPRQSIRMTLLLAFATAFAIFSLVFISSQSQRVLDVSAFQGGADFSGPLASTSALRDLGRQTRAYDNIRGVLSTSLGYTASLQAGDVLAIPIELRAVDAGTFARSAIWTSQDSSQSLDALMNQLISGREEALARNAVPAIVDSATVQALHLSPGATFTLGATGSTGVIVTFVVMAEVQHIPTVSSSGQNGSGSDYVPAGGVLVDYPTYATIYTQTSKAQGGSDTIPLNYAWLRTRSDGASLESVRGALSRGNLQITSLYDRREVLDALGHEPLYLDLLGVLAIGATTALFLALMGNLIASWLSARGRLTNFAVMRALGTTPRQVASVLTWEQSIIYTAAILLGVVFGALLSALVVPVLVFTGVPASGSASATSNGAFYVSQSVPPIQIIVSPWVGLALVAVVIICVVALGWMVRIVSRPSIGQTLRLNED